ncbi:MAG TPA: M23 family metallopeptidase [Bacteroidia bacterium]|nr:M23 family metallopeptidase [Bacteroidia bacterium]QQR94332.1 MAG: M23 family metallopeptidase [Bacteroidota bacterium]MBP7714627.1 M23 family metallopeptidase [Bacteroidia bacterium]MBP8669312.1 M23 family metallopeptidase [Bacteroidia bacterium]HOZ81810.1 M23 family metallopeptidase [Bacteroidia bacterium]
MKVAIFLTCIFTLIISNAYSQQTAIPLSPLTIPLIQKGNYGEVRSNHFHSGLDFSTQTKIGFPVIASFDGYVSRIKTSENGYGKAVYIDHPNGLTTVYAHLHRYGRTIEQLVFAEQEKQKKYSIELFPERNKITVRQGDTIGWSGNSGGSSGPHLHYEIRNTKSEKPLNPINYFPQIKDSIPPLLKSITIYSIKEDFLSIFPWHEIKPVETSRGNYSYTELISASGEIGIGFSGYDQANDDNAILGIDEAELYANEKLIYARKMSNFSFDETRNANGLIDYAKGQRTGSITERCYKLPGVKFSQYIFLKNSGVVDLENDSIINFRLMLRDGVGNISRCVFTVAYSNNAKPKNTVVKKGELLEYNKANKIQSDRYKLMLPAGALFRDFYCDAIIRRGNKSFIAPQITIGNTSEGLKKNITLKIKSDLEGDSLNYKTIMVKIASNGTASPVSGIYKDGWYSASISSFGTYSLMVDSISPVIENISTSFDSVYNCPVLEIKVSDNFSGIKNYSCMINNKWHLSEYDRKNGTIYVLLNQFAESKFNIKIDLSDMCNNTTTLSKEIILSKK